MAKKKNGKKGGKTPLSDKLFILIADIIMGLLAIGCIVFTVRHAKLYFDAKNYSSTIAHIVGETDINTITKEDSYGNVTSVKKYYTYKYAFLVDGEEYSGEKNNTEEYYGETFVVMYDPGNPGRYVIGSENSFPVGLCIASAFLIAIEGFGIFKLITE